MVSVYSKLTKVDKYPLYIKNRIVRLGLYISSRAESIRNVLIIRSLRKQGVSIGEFVAFIGKPVITVYRDSNISVGNKVMFISSPQSATLSVNHACTLRTLSENSEIVIKDNAGMTGVTICSAQRVEIGERVMLGANVMIADTDFHSLDWRKRWTANDHANSAPVIIEDDVFVGMNTCILKGVRIGAKSVIGANSTVTKDIPPFSIAAGNPAKVIGSINDILDKE